MVDTDRAADGVTGGLKVLVVLPQRADAASALMFEVYVGKDNVKIEWPNTPLKVEGTEWVRFTAAMAAMERGLWDLSHAVVSPAEAIDATEEVEDAPNGKHPRASTA